MPKPYSLDLRERVVSFVQAGHSRRAGAAHFRVSPSFVINLRPAFRGRGALAPKALGGWRHSKLDPHRVFILRRVAEKDAISMPELAGELKAASGVKADPASLSRWLIRKRSADPAVFGAGGGAIVGVVGGSDTCRFQSIVTCPRARARAWRSGSRSS